MKITKMVEDLSSIGYGVIIEKNPEDNLWEVTIWHKDWLTNSLGSARVFPKSKAENLKLAIMYMWYVYYRYRGKE